MLRGCAGKTTLLQILAGQYMVDKDAVRVLGRPAFHDIALTSSGELSYLGQQWRRDIAFAGYNVPIQVRMACPLHAHDAGQVQPPWGPAHPRPRLLYSGSRSCSALLCPAARKRIESFSGVGQWQLAHAL